MHFEDKLFVLGVSTFITEIVTPFPAPGQPNQTFQVGKTLSEDVGFIYGLSTYADGVDVANIPLPSTTQCQQTFFVAQNGATIFMEPTRLDDMLNVFSGSPVVRPERYYRVNIPRFDISKSYYANPTLITGPINIRLRLHYIQAKDWLRVKEKLFPSSEEKK